MPEKNEFLSKRNSWAQSTRGMYLRGKGGEKIREEKAGKLSGYTRQEVRETFKVQKKHGFHCYASHQMPGNLNQSAAVHLLLFLAPPGIISGPQDLGRHSNNLLSARHKPRATLGCV